MMSVFNSMKKNIPRLYQPVDLSIGLTMTLSDNAFRHAVKSLRLRENDVVVLFNGQGGEYYATLTSISKHHADVYIERFDEVSRESDVFVHLGQCISRPERMDYAIQKSVEVGVSEITPIIAERCQFKLPADRLSKRMAHWQQVIISACEQSGRTGVPKLHEPQPLATWIIDREGDCFVCDEAEIKQSHYQVGKRPVSLLIGPEGGLTADEKEACYRAGFNGFSLGSRILRTETAPVVAITLLQNLSNSL